MRLCARGATLGRSFTDAQQLHCQRYARMRGLAKVLEQWLLAAAAQNMKKIALLLRRLLRFINALAIVMLACKKPTDVLCGLSMHSGCFYACVVFLCVYGYSCAASALIGCHLLRYIHAQSVGQSVQQDRYSIGC